MNIRVNGKIIDTKSETLDELCASLGYDESAKIATAVNGEFVPAGMRKNQSLAGDDEVEIVAPRQGG